MRSLVISALSRPRETSSRSVFMLTGTTSWTIGSTKAPPFITTFWPPRPVRTKARSFDERRYSQFISHTTIATTIATTTSPRIADPNCAPVMRAPCKACSDWGGAAPLLPQAPPPPCSFPLAPVRLRPDSSSRPSSADLLELPGRLGQRHLGRQPLQAGGAVETVALPAMFQDVARVGGPGNRSAVAERDDVLVHRPGGSRPGVDERHAVPELERGLGADGAARGEPQVADHDVRARLGHVHRVLLREHVGGGEQVALVGRADHLDLEAVAHPRLLALGGEPGPRAAADDRLAAPDHGPELLEAVLTGDAGHGRAHLT